MSTHFRSGDHQSSNTRQQLRLQIRQQRQQLDPQTQHLSALAVTACVLQQRWFQLAQRVAFYLPADGEIDCRLLLQQALKMGKQVCLPVVSPLSAQHMHFVRVRCGQTLSANRWGLYEPALRRADIIPPMTLDLVFVPLVGFDQLGNRLGMGKGFYDRAFAFRRQSLHRPQRRLPQLAGLAHDCQQLPRIPAQHWDVPLDRVVTPSGCINTGP